ncbi:hypothetical protein [Crenalkalicoccus roseus]|uniref:hypothetical protein n=1 Tax=Crenalkalicoccus roseus TaxID=1485588 RepID=UPI0010820319|nr:hypothetical protein [Crenalkalicoccus roseus]
MSRTLGALLALSALLGTAYAPLAHGHDWQPYMPEDVNSVFANGGNRNVVGGGGVATITGSGVDHQLTYAGPLQTQPPIFAEYTGSEEDRTITYTLPEERSRTLAALAARRGPARR